MAFILTALKLIGIVLAVVIAIIIAVAVVVLVMPFKYEFSGEKYEKIKAAACVRWLFGIVKVSFSFDDGESELGAAVFGKVVYPKKEAPKEIKVRGGASSENKEANETLAEKKAEPEKKEPEKKEPKKEPPKEATEAPKKKPAKKAEAMAKKEAGPRVTKVKMPEVSEFPPEEEEPPKKTIKDFVLGYLKDMPNEDKKLLIVTVLGTIKGVIRHILPEDISLYAVIGTDDPSVTGYILAGAGIARGATGKDILVQGDFERKRAEGEAFIKGRIRLGTLLYIMLRLLITRPVRKFIIGFIKVRGELV